MENVRNIIRLILSEKFESTLLKKEVFTISIDDTKSNNENDNFLNILNSYWSTIPSDQQPSYTNFNCVIPLGSNKDVLRNMEKNCEQIGIANYETLQEGISTLSFIATITDLLCGERLAAKIENNKIIGWEFYSKS